MLLPKKIRAFWAFNLPHKVIDDIQAIQNHLKGKYPKLKWVKPNNIHLTLHFLGDIEQEKLSSLIDIATRQLKNIQALQLSLGDIGVFPNYYKPRVIWLALCGDMQPLIKLYQQTEAMIYEIKHPIQTKSFSPHITVARVPNWYDYQKNDMQLLKEYKHTKKYNFLIKELTLYQSTLTQNGPIYTALHTTNFL